MDRLKHVGAVETTSTTHTAREWVRGKALGSGSFGRVSMALDACTGEPFAVKSVAAEPDTAAARTSLKALENEIRTLESLSSPYVVRYLGNSWTEETGTDGGMTRMRNLHMELAPGGSLASLLKAVGRNNHKNGDNDNSSSSSSGSDKGLEEQLTRRYTKDIVRALAYLHARGIVHGDVKCLNVLLSSSGARLADFGAAYHVGSSQQTVGGLTGSPLWMSPETVTGGAPQSTAVDIWSLGCTVLEMATGRAPWSEALAGGVYRILHTLKCTNSLPAVPDSLHADIRDFVSMCLRRNPVERPTAEELLRHPLLSGGERALLPPEVPPCLEEVPPPVPILGDSHPSPTGACGWVKVGRKRPVSCLSATANCSTTQRPSPSAQGQHVQKKLIGPHQRSKSLDESAAATAEWPKGSRAGVQSDSSGPSFPILDVALLQSTKWGSGDEGPMWPQSSLMEAAEKWIVVRSPGSSPLARSAQSSYCDA